MANVLWKHSALLKEIRLIPTNKIKLEVIDTAKSDTVETSVSDLPSIEPLDSPAVSSSDIIPYGNMRTLAFRIADKIQDETRKLCLFRNRKNIINRLNELNNDNILYFIGYMITTSKSQSVLGDIRNYITYDSMNHLLLCILKQAEDCGLKESFQFKKLKREYNTVIKNKEFRPNKIVNKKHIDDINLYIENLYLEMSKIIHC